MIVRSDKGGMMYRTKDFLLMDVNNAKGDKLGAIHDVLVHFGRREVVGFQITKNSFINSIKAVATQDILSYNSAMVVSEVSEEQGLKFSRFKGLDVMDVEGNIIGMVEEIIFNSNLFKIKGMLVSTGLISDFLYGKKVILIDDLIIGEHSILKLKRHESFTFRSLPHKIFMEEDENERNREKKTI